MASPTPRTTRRTLLLGLAALGLAGSTATADAHPPLRPHARDFEVVLEDAWGRPLDTFDHHGQRFVLGQYGDRYAVRLVNHTSRRVEAVLTVDGRDAISGRPGDYVRQRGYLIRPFDSVVVKGFRKNLDEVATFRFTNPGDSYSARMGTPENVGVIGAAFFEERERYVRSRPRPLADRPSAPRKRKNPNPRAGGRRAPREADSGASQDAQEPKASAAPRRERSASRHDRGYDDREYSRDRDNLGTQYGETRTSRVTEVSFRRAHATRPSAIVTVRYDDERGLESRGIEVRPPRRVPWWRRHEPAAFPESRFAPPPP